MNRYANSKPTIKRFRHTDCGGINVVLRRRKLGLVFYLAMTNALLCLLISTQNAIAQDGLQATELKRSRIADLLATPHEKLLIRRLVRIKGTVSSVADGIATPDSFVKASLFFCVEDDTAGILMPTYQAINDGLLENTEAELAQLKYGVDVEVEGFLEKGGYAPQILPVRISILGQSELPAAPLATMSEFLSGANELRRVKVSGVVQNMVDEPNHLLKSLVRVEVGNGHFLVRLPKQEEYSPQRLLDAEIELTGLASDSRNWRSEFVCPRLIVNRFQDIKILKEAPRDPFAIKKVSLSKLDGFTLNGRPLHRRRVEGTVTYYDQERLLYIQDEGIGIRVQLSKPNSIGIGDRVEVAGFIDKARYLAGLHSAIVRPLSGGESPKAINISMPEIVEQHQSLRGGSTYKSCDGQLIKLQGRVLSSQPATADKPIRLEIDCGDTVATAYLNKLVPKNDIENLQPGTDLELTGVAVLTFAAPDTVANLAMPTRVTLLLRDSADIRVLKHLPWWTARRTFTALLVVLGIAFSTFVWAFTLRRTLSQRSKQLEREMRSRRDAAIEFQGAMRERTRLAANLHDTVLQTMAGIAYQIEACNQPDVSDKNGIGKHLETAQRMIKFGQEDLRNTVWALHSLPLDEETLADSVKKAADRINLGHPTEITVVVCEDFPALADFIAGNLLLVISEAIQNSVKHAKAEKIKVEMQRKSGEERVWVSITDDGNGFDIEKRPTSSDGHFGIEGMTQRIEGLGGSLLINSHPGTGTTVTAEVPLQGFDSNIAS